MRRLAAAVAAGVVLCSVVVAPVGAAEPTTFVALDGEEGDFVSRGRDWRYDRRNAVIRVAYGQRVLRVLVAGSQDWGGQFPVPDGASRLTEGRYEVDEPLWSGYARACSTARGWFAIDDIRYRHGEVVRVSLRFAQRCDGRDEALRGQVAWSAASWAPRPPNPRPRPERLWRPPADAIPSSGNVVYLRSDEGDYIGQGKTYRYRPGPGEIDVIHYNGFLGVDLKEVWWSGSFAGPSVTDHLTGGFYGGVERYPFDNPVEGGLDWSGHGRGCNLLSGWFSLDRFKKVAGELRAFTLRFVQRCESSSSALRGFVRWHATTPRPVQPFRDIVGHRHELAMTRLAEAGAIKGYRDGTFRPRGTVTRGQIATFIARAMGYRPSADAPDFSDIQDSPHRNHIRALAEWKIVSGFKDGTYRPDLPISRGHLAELLTRADLPYSPQPFDPFFFDALGTRHDDATRALIVNRIARPVGSGRFRPADLATRAATAALLARVANFTAELRNR